MPDLPHELRHFPERLAEVINRTTRGNLSAFARLSRVADSTLKQYLDGISLPGLANLLRIALAAGVSLDTLVLGPREERAAASLTAKDQL